MPASCKDQKKAVAICLQRSPCVMLERNKPQDCLDNPELRKDLPELCLAQMRAFLDCKKGILDMTKRFTGNGPLSTGKYDQQYDNLCAGNFDPREELHRLEVLDSTRKD
ncbi:hypothetical protein TBLA_0C01570 [Henningerozyma blattae CBS 6284]|uniref:Uncharacterized protein n=1 Tax=Henningerozyma blattae (strain ATCC 34711 / CBS 6284 / DSM 70876 / NBRC 10599 / NRRL Y-10934 / UCD 77-7) TaxID=1071380 RepID=I2H0R9_HENB6|nr:hypothetical protein TBLA_0C01570 [Tetrapisispora blattae CBS 6284]CCH59971.1 hypothetical protein TBLA_0C01570 [Tetrapisispora blattae CBS 6284]